MLFQVRRLRTDLRQIRRSLFAIAAVTFIAALVTTYMAVFSLAEARSGALSTRPPREPVSFLRAIDPQESIATRYESAEELTHSVLDEPGPAVLLDRMARDDRTFITLPLNAFVNRLGSDASVDASLRAVIGTAPPFLDRAPGDGAVLLWGSLSGQEDARGFVSDTALDGHPVEQVGVEPLAADFVNGAGRRVSSAVEALVAVDTLTAREVGVSTLGVAEIVNSFTCYCEAGDLVELAQAMSLAEREAGTGRAYYPVAHDELIGPAERSYALTGALITAQGVGTLLSAWCVAVMGAHVFWARRGPSYMVERLAGSSESALHARSQLVVALALTFPALAGLELVHLAMRSSTWPPPLTQREHVTAVAVILSLHVLAGALSWIRISRICRYPYRGVADV